MSVAVVEFQVKGIDDTNAGGIITEWVIDAVNKQQVYALKERVSLDRLVSEQKLGVSGLINEETAAKIGQMYGVKGIILGSVMKLGGTYSVTARLVDVETASILSTGSVTTQSIDAIAGMVNDLCAQLTAQKSGAALPVKTTAAVATKPAVLPQADYSRAMPLLNLALPGSAQYQAGDPAPGTLFLVLWAGGLGLFGYSEIQFQQAFSKYEAARLPAVAQSLYSDAEAYRNMSIAGVGVAVVAAAVSYIHATLQPAGTSRTALAENPVQIAAGPDAVSVTFSGRF